MAVAKYTYICACCKKTIYIQNPRQGKGTECRACMLKNNHFNRKHGFKNTRLYNTWAQMKGRCENAAFIGAKYYSERGKSFEPFRDWALANGYADNLQLDRYPDNNGNYEPSNCRWATPAQNIQNSRLAKLTAEDVVEIRKLLAETDKTQKEIGEMFGVRHTMISRIYLGLNWKNI